MSERDLEIAFNIRYLRSLEYIHWKIEQRILKYCQKALQRDRIPEHAKWLGALHAKEMETPPQPDVQIAWIDEEIGYGVFANAPIKKWSFLGEYAGVVRERKLFFPNVNDYCFSYPKHWLTLSPLAIDSEKEGNFTRFINHSDHPNLESVSIFFNGTMHIIFRAIRDIKIGEELSYDYGDVYWEKRKKREETSDPQP